jgi:hypothetical protein
MTDYFAAILDLILNSPDPNATLKRANELIDLAEDSQIQISAVPQTEQRVAL